MYHLHILRTVNLKGRQFVPVDTKTVSLKLWKQFILSENKKIKPFNRTYILWILALEIYLLIYDILNIIILKSNFIINLNLKWSEY